MNIKAKNILFAVAVFMQGTNLFLNIILHDGGKESIIAFLLASIVGGVMLLFACGSKNKYKEEKGFLSKTSEFLLILFFVVYGAFTLNILSSFISGYVLHETPKKIFILLFIAVCTYCAAMGYDNLLRLSVLFFILILFSDLLNIFLLRDKMELENFLPVFVTKTSKFIFVFLKSLVLLMGDMAVFLHISQKEKKYMLTGYFIGAAFLSVIVIRTVASLGNMLSVYTWPTHEALRIISSGNTLTRIETSSVFVLLLIMFYKISMLFCVATEEIRKKSGAKGRGVSAIAVGTAAYFISVNIASSGAQAMDIWQKAGVYITAGIVLLLILTLKRQGTTNR